jgi:DNA-binding phage protein
MGMQDFLLKQAMKWKLKDMPAAQQEQIMALVQKNPELFKKIGEEVDRRVKKGGEPQMKATMEVMKKYRAELQALQQSL